MEATGLVLGALPMVIKALQTYRSILATMKNTKRELESMIRDLTTEMVILQNTCEILLRGIVPESEIDFMIEHPYDEAWKDYSEQLRLRMWRSNQLFRDRVEDMMRATAELRERLALNEQGQTRLMDRASIYTELKRRTSFTLRKDEYSSILARLHDGNAVLSALATQNGDLEPVRRSRSGARAARLIRRLSAGIFSALQEAITCSCIESHELGLVIPRRQPVMLPGDVEEDAARSLHFDVVLGTNGNDFRRWDGIRVKVAEKKIISRVLVPPPTRLKSPTRRLRWALLPMRTTKVDPTSSPSQAARVTPMNCVSEVISPRSPVTNLCQVLRKGKGVSSDCYGFINGKLDEFDLYHQECLASYYSTITLRNILEGRSGHIDNFGYPERLRLALTLSFGVLNLYSTPWLSEVISLDEVFFIPMENTARQDNFYLDRPFLAKKVQGKSAEADIEPLKSAKPDLMSKQQRIPTNKNRPIDSTLLSFGLLLIQIIIGNYSEQLHVEEGMTMDAILEKQTIAFEMAGLVLQNGGMNYAGAVQWCLENFLSVANLDNEELAGQFYDCVIFKLETDMKFQGPAMSV